MADDDSRMADDDSHDDSNDHYSNIRELLGGLIGQRVIDITQHDEEEFLTEHACYVSLHFENGLTVTFHIGEDNGFDLQEPD